MHCGQVQTAVDADIPIFRSQSDLPVGKKRRNRLRNLVLVPDQLLFSVPGTFFPVFHPVSDFCLIYRYDMVLKPSF